MPLAPAVHWLSKSSAGLKPVPKVLSARVALASATGDHRRVCGAKLQRCAVCEEAAQFRELLRNSPKMLLYLQTTWAVPLPNTRANLPPEKEAERLTSLIVGDHQKLKPTGARPTHDTQPIQRRT
jgi:hypothetical protein